MNPNHIVIDGQRLAEVLTAILVVSFFVERALAIVFEHRWFVDRFSEKGIKEPVAFAVAMGICRYWQFDAVSALFGREQVLFWGEVVTAACSPQPFDSSAPAA